MTSRIQYNNPDSLGALGLPYHYEGVSDVRRLTPFKEAINESCKGKRVLESGTGSGILSILAARAGAERVYTVEIDPEVARFAEENIQKSGYKIIKFIQKDTKDVTLEDLEGEKVDVVIAENLSTWQVTEPQIPVMNHINRFLVKDDGVRIPTRVFNYLELAQSQYRFEDAVDLRTHYFEFTGINKPEVLSQKVLLREIDLREINPTSIDEVVRVKVTKSGVLNGLRLTSPLQLYKGITFDSSDSLMPPVIVPLREDLSVSIDEIVEVHIRYSHHTNWDKFVCEARLVNVGEVVGELEGGDGLILFN